MNIIYASKLEEDAKIPARKHWNDAGMDLFAYQESAIYPQKSEIVRTGVSVDIPDGYVGIVKAKSRSDFVIGAGVVDSGYQGEILVKIFNTSNEIITIEKNEAVAQMLITPCITGEVEELPVKELHKTKSERGESGGIATQLSFLEGIISKQEAADFMEEDNGA